MSQPGTQSHSPATALQQGPSGMRTCMTQVSMFFPQYRANFYNQWCRPIQERYNCYKQEVLGKLNNRMFLKSWKARTLQKRGVFCFVSFFLNIQSCKNNALPLPVPPVRSQFAQKFQSKSKRHTIQQGQHDCEEKISELQRCNKDPHLEDETCYIQRLPLLTVRVINNEIRETMDLTSQFWQQRLAALLEGLCQTNTNSWVQHDWLKLTGQWDTEI